MKVLEFPFFSPLHAEGPPAAGLAYHVLKKTKKDIFLLNLQDITGIMDIFEERRGIL